MKKTYDIDMPRISHGEAYRLASKIVTAGHDYDEALRRSHEALLETLAAVGGEFHFDLPHRLDFRGGKGSLSVLAAKIHDGDHVLLLVKAEDEREKVEEADAIDLLGDGAAYLANVILDLAEEDGEDG